MPVYLRNFYMKKLTDTKQKENDEIQKAQQRAKGKGVSRPSMNPRFKR